MHLNNDSGKKIGKENNFNDETGKKIGKENNLNDETGKKIGKKEDMLLKYLSEEPKITISKLARNLGIATSTVQTYLDKLKSANKIRRVGPDKGGHWEIL